MASCFKYRTSQPPQTSSQTCTQNLVNLRRGNLCSAHFSMCCGDMLNCLYCPSLGCGFMEELNFSKQLAR